MKLLKKKNCDSKAHLEIRLFLVSSIDFYFTKGSSCHFNEFSHENQHESYRKEYIDDGTHLSDKEFLNYRQQRKECLNSNCDLLTNATMSFAHVNKHHITIGNHE